MPFIQNKFFGIRFQSHLIRNNDEEVIETDLHIYSREQISKDTPPPLENLRNSAQVLKNLSRPQLPRNLVLQPKQLFFNK